MVDAGGNLNLFGAAQPQYLAHGGKWLVLVGWDKRGGESLQNVKPKNRLAAS